MSMLGSQVVVKSLLRPTVFLLSLFGYLLSTGTMAADSEPPEQTWQVNLKDADIRAFVSQVADITGYNFVVDPRVKGKVTVISNSSMSRDDVYEMFLSVLQVHGFTAIPAEDIIKVVPQNEAKQTGDNLALLPRVPKEQVITRVIQVNNANAMEMVPILRPMVAKYGHLAAVSAANALIISDHVANIERIEKIVAELDSPSKYELEVIQLKEAWVGDLVKLLEELAPNELGKKSSKGRSQKYSVVADERSNRLILRGDENFRQKIRELIDKLDQPAATAGTTKVVKLQHADAKNLADLLKGLMGDVQKESKEKGKGKASDLPASVYADEGLNALVIRAEPSVMREVERVIAQLDVRRAQVLIEAAIVEVSDESNQGLGVQWALGSPDGAVPGALTNFGNVGLSAADVLTAIATKSTSFPSPSQGGATVGLGNVDESGLSWGALIQALSTNTDTNLLSTPTVITMDNQESKIVVGQNVPFKTGQSTSTVDGTTNPFTTITREDVGVKLTVTPSISEGDTVRLEINQEISSVDDSVESASDIVTNTREISTAVLADDKEIIVLGGLIADDVRNSVSKVPLLGDLPLLGSLFSSTEVRKSKRNLIVFLRPTILRDKGHSREISERLYDGLWELNLERVSDKKVPNEVQKPALEKLFRKNELDIEQ